ncbi:hypothetical protein IOQ59_18380 [Pontibacterium sp. N1Y112]|uniref:Uncharacterized protein n=1 Tax=Pontibacterium sinense TaxID=2781979 RepID=A0A8J7FJR0_9GAMM|nr:hypothetical protein [Pontibacterium sinense]MBE9399233.1 hypothetical protein [Pontibacterium sinense]
MKLIMKSLLGVVAAMLFVSSVTAETLRPSYDFDDDWEERVLRFTPEQHENVDS